MEEILVHLDQIKENILKQKDDSNEQSKYFDKITFNNLDNNKTLNKKSNYNYFKMISISRPSIIDISQNIKTIDMSHKFYLIEESSDNEDGYNEDTKAIMPSLTKVAKNIFDPNLIMILTDIKYFPSEAKPRLIISGIEEWVTEKHIKYFLKGVPSFIDKNKSEKNRIDLEINSIKFFTEQQKRYAYVKVNSKEQMEIIGNFFLNPIKKLYPSYNSKKEKIEIYYAYDLLNITKNHWYGVILRNLPANCNDKSIYNFTEQKIKNGIKYCLNPIEIDNIYCALVVCKELEYAEKLCHDLNNSEINNKYIKAHLHPNICKIRNEAFLSNYETFNKDGYLYSEDAEQSEKYLNFAKSFMEFFYPDYLKSFNNNKSKKKEKNIKNVNDINESNMKNKEKEKNIKREKDLTLASSILDLFKKSKSIEDLKKTNSQNLKEKNIINNNNIQNNQNNNMIIEKQSSEISLNMNIKTSLFAGQNSSTNLDIIQENSKVLSEDNNTKTNENKENDEENKEKNNSNNINDNINKEINDNNIIKYSQEEIDYYTYNMGDKKYYDEIEMQNLRRTSSYKQRNSNYKEDFKGCYNSNSNYNKDYQSQRYEHSKNISSSPRRQYNTSYKKNNSGYGKDRDYYNKRSYDNYKEKSKENDRERSREASLNQEKDKYQDNRDNRDKRFNYYNNSDKGKRIDRDWNQEKDRDWNRDKGWNRENYKIKDKEWENNWEKNKDREKERDRDKGRERFSDDRYRRSNDYRYNERNDRNYNNNYNERRKESYQSNNRQRNDKDKRNRYSYNNHNENKF